MSCLQKKNTRLLSCDLSFVIVFCVLCFFFFLSLCDQFFVIFIFRFFFCAFVC